MSSIFSAVFKATIGLLVNKGRDKAAEKLKDGDVTDQRIRELIVREIDDIKSKLDGLARRDLLTGISYFRRGVGSLFELLAKAASGSHGSAKNPDVSLRSKATAATRKTVSIAEGFKKLTVTDLDDGDKRQLANSKEEFKIACLKATEAFNNEALSTSDRIQAMVIRVAATILEKVDYPQDALTACRLCLEELHSMPAVQGSFAVEFEGGFRARFSKAVRSEIIDTVLRLNYVIYDITLMVLGDVDRDMISNWPSVDFKMEKVCVISDLRVRESIRKLGLGPYWVPVPWSFGLGILIAPVGFASNSEAEFIVADQLEGLWVFDNTGRNRYSLDTSSLRHPRLMPLDVTTDKGDDIYVLTRVLQNYPLSDSFELNRIQYDTLWTWVYCFKKKSREHFIKFPLRTLKQAQYHSLTVGYYGNNVLALGNAEREKQSRSEVAVFEPHGQFLRTFGERILEGALDISAANDNRVMVLDRGGDCVQVFSEDGKHLFHFQLQTSLRCSKITFSRSIDCVVVAADGKVLIYTNKGQYVNDFEVYANKIQGITAFDRCIGLACADKTGESTVLVFKLHSGVTEFSTSQVVNEV